MQIVITFWKFILGVSFLCLWLSKSIRTGKSWILNLHVKNTLNFVLRFMDCLLYFAAKRVWILLTLYHDPFQWGAGAMLFVTCIGLRIFLLLHCTPLHIILRPVGHWKAYKPAIYYCFRTSEYRYCQVLPSSKHIKQYSDSLWRPHSMALTNEGQIYRWGHKLYGQLVT